MRILITGGTGYIGSTLAAHARQKGHEAIALGREGFNLAQPLAFSLPAGIDAVFHLAAQTSHDHSLTQAQEVSAAQHLFSECRAKGARFYFISSQAAQFDAPSRYGKTKWAIEQSLPAEAVIVRPGLVYGGAQSGLFGLLSRMARFQILPMIMPVPIVQPVHIDDLCEALIRILSFPAVPSPLCIAGEPVDFTRLLNYFAKQQHHKPPLFIPVPVWFLVFVLKLAGIISARFSFLAERVASLAANRPMKCAESLNALSMKLRTFLPASVLRKALLAEARLMLAPFLKMHAEPSLLARYARACESQALQALPAHFLNRHYLRLHEVPFMRSSARRLPCNETIRARFAIALAVAQTSPRQSDAFIKTKATFLPLAYFSLGWMIVKEFLASLLYGALLLIISLFARGAR